MITLRDLLGYVLAKTGCIHPFRISRIIALAEILYMRRNNKRFTNIKYVGFDKVFYIEGLKETVENDACFERREGDPSKHIRGCIEYKCEAPNLPSDVREVIDEAINTASKLNDEELNKIVIDDPLFSRLLSS
jgi:hydroxypyruvate isomerase